MVPENIQDALTAHDTRSGHRVQVGDRVGYIQDNGGYVIKGTVTERRGGDGWGAFAWIVWDDTLPLRGCWMDCAPLFLLDEIA